MDNDARILLDDTISFCRRDGQDRRLISMLEQSVPTVLDDDALTIEAPSRFAYTYLVKQRQLIERYLEEIAFAPLTLNVVVPGAEGQASGAAPGQTPIDAPALDNRTGFTGGDMANFSADGGISASTPRAGTLDEAPRNRENPFAASAFDSVAQRSEAPFADNGASAPQAATADEGRFAPYAAPADGGATAGAAGRVTAPQPAYRADAADPATMAPQATVSNQPPFSPAEPRPATGVGVKNTLSAEEFRRMMAQMKEGDSRPHTAAVSPAAETTPPPAEEQYPSVGVSSKFTFENFVFGDENKHAYQSAVRFAAFADEPGTCASLFIYGNSGLGKTHLLFAVKNYLAAEKPYLRVKYANSQAYLDDYMHDLGMQKGPGDPIMREYRDADILIIDDIQNIIGKQASIEFFFQLVDEFIRTGKKIAIASDRAPKNLGLDERLTSRFNAGMLCLVSEPGFEMKYAILKNYYENTICGGSQGKPEGGVPSILDGLELQEGHLSKAQLERMAEISGNNIRELESFCERCAGLSYERERTGRELSAEDIDRIAEEYFNTAHKVVKAPTVLSVVEEFYHVSHEDMIGRKRSKNIAFPRHVAAYLANTMCEMPLKAVGALFGRDHTTVIHSIEVIEKREGEDMRFREELQQLKNVILLKS